MERRELKLTHDFLNLAAGQGDGDIRRFLSESGSIYPDE
ncbi:hypothetical protein STRNTR1_1595 [Stenotrophomonas maltophilia]|nr:hypothetical protein STRNTR1_1595 [Stenotrophomonas maltophilia]